MAEEPEQQDIPTIILKLTDPVVFNVEIDLDIRKLYLCRAIVSEALASVNRMIADQEAEQFAARMSRVAQAHRAMQKQGGLPKM